MPAASDGSKPQRPRVTVVIPFFQRSPGILRRALESIFAQDFVPTPSVIVVDDASPVPAVDEVASLPVEHAAHVTVIRQANAGPGAARNRALDALADDVDYVAYLDSDDIWLPGHLARAVAALEAGNDFYFSNYRDIGHVEGAFEVRQRLEVALHEPVSGMPDIRLFSGDLCGAVLTACPVETSTVVFRWSEFRRLRFRREFRHAYEDLMYWFEIGSASALVVFSPVVGTQYGEGVNIYRSVEPNSEADMRLVVGSTMFGAGVRRVHRLTETQRSAVKSRLNRNRRALAYHLLHRARRRQRCPAPELAAFLRADPASWVLLPLESLRQVARWLAGRGLDQ
jgi:succinoglycan biosynthesis protein ExoW